MGQARSNQQYILKIPDDEERLAECIVGLAGQHRRYGYCRITALSRGEGLRVNYNHIWSDNGSEFTTNVIRSWLKDLGVTTRHIEPESPWENGYVESSSGKLRDELLDRSLINSFPASAQK